MIGEWARAFWSVVRISERRGNMLCPPLHTTASEKSIESSAALRARICHVAPFWDCNKQWG